MPKNQKVKPKAVLSTEERQLLHAIESRLPTQAILILDEHQTFSPNALNQALISACRAGLKFLAQKLVHMGADVNFCDASGKSPLMLAAASNFSDLVRFLLMKKAHVNAADSEGNTALILSISPAGSGEVIKCLLENKDLNLNHQNLNGYTAIMKAIEVRDVDAMILLIDEHSSKKGRKSLSVDDIDKFLNSKMESAKQIAERCGLGGVYTILKTHVLKNTSPLTLAMDAFDVDSFNILLDCQFANFYEYSSIINDAFSYIFTKLNTSEDRSVTEDHMKIIKKLLACGADVNTACYSGLICLCVAVKSGHYGLVELLCQNGASINPSVYLNDDDPMCIAASSGRCDLVKLLMKYLRYYDVINSRPFSLSALNSALSHGFIKCAKLLIRHGAKLDIKAALTAAVQCEQPEYLKFVFVSNNSETVKYLADNPDFTATLLNSAVQGGNLGIIGQILVAGADINGTDSSSHSPLMKALSVEVARFLIKNGANVNGASENSRPLFHFLKSGVIAAKDIVQVLLESGASVKESNNEGLTPLMIAASVPNRADILQTLLDHGADIGERDMSGKSPLMHAITGRCNENASFLIGCCGNRQDILNYQSNTGVTTLMQAVTRSTAAVVNELIIGGADINATDSFGNTALFYSLKSDMGFPIDEVLRTLVIAGSDVNLKNHEGVSPLMVAAEKGRKDALILLVDAGAEVNGVSEKEGQRKSALSFATDNCSLDIGTLSCIPYLLERGAAPSFINQVIFHRMILHGCKETVRQLILRGLGPTDIPADSIKMRILKSSQLTTLSPLGMALLVGNELLARSMYECLFLTQSDVVSLIYSKTFRGLVEKSKQQDCLTLLDEISSQPLSLFALSFVATSSALGTYAGRESRINQLPLPPMMKDKLLFTSATITSNEIPVRLGAETMIIGEEVLDYGMFDEFHPYGEDYDIEAGANFPILSDYSDGGEDDEFDIYSVSGGGYYDHDSDAGFNYFYDTEESWYS